MNSPKSGLILGTLLLSAAPLALADSVLRGTLDGEARVWHVVQGGGNSTASFRADPAYIDVTLQGHAEKRFSTKGALSISLLAMGGQPPDEAEVMYFPEATMLPHYSSEGEAAEFEITEFSIDGDQLHIAGRYRGTLRYVETIRPQSPSSKRVEIDVEFDMVVPRED